MYISVVGDVTGSVSLAGQDYMETAAKLTHFTKQSAAWDGLTHLPEISSNDTSTMLVNTCLSPLQSRLLVGSCRITLLYPPSLAPLYLTSARWTKVTNYPDFPRNKIQ